MIISPHLSENSLDSEILLQAYASGIFPMSTDVNAPDIFWVQPERRGIIPLEAFHQPKSLLKTIKRKEFEIRINYNFEEIIRACAKSEEKRPDTWINQIIIDAYTKLYKQGYCHTVEAWQDNQLAGGLYGISLGRAFFGESMFSRKKNASKLCLSFLVKHLRERGFELLDIQYVTDHLQRFGAIEITREEYEIRLTKALTGKPSLFSM